MFGGSGGGYWWFTFLGLIYVLDVFTAELLLQMNGWKSWRLSWLVGFALESNKSSTGVSILLLLQLSSFGNKKRWGWKYC